MITQVQYLLMLAEDARDKGDNLDEDMRRKGGAHFEQLVELSELITRAKAIVDNEIQRFRAYAPRQATAQAQAKLPKHLINPQNAGTQQKVAE